MVADHYTNPDDSDVRVEAEQDAGDLYCGVAIIVTLKKTPG
jgi:hypothetical protein